MESQRGPAVLLDNASLDRAEVLHPRCQVLVRQVVPVETHQQQSPSTLFLGGEPLGVHQAVAAEQMAAGGVLAPFAAVATVEGQGAGQKVLVHADNQDLLVGHFHERPFQGIFDRLHLPAELFPRDRQRSPGRMRNARQAERHVVQ